MTQEHGGAALGGASRASTVTLVAVLCLLACCALAQEGDTSLSGTLSTEDLNLLLDHIVHRTTLSGQALLNADLNNDGRVDAADVASLNLILNAPTADADGDGVPNGVELGMGTDPYDPDSDGDTISDGAEDQEGDLLPDWMEFVLGTDPALADTDGDGTNDVNEDGDGDGLSDYDELLLGTDYALADTDGDGFGDGDESLLGSDPFSATSIPIFSATSNAVRFQYLNLAAGGADLNNTVGQTIRYRFLNPSAGGGIVLDSTISPAVRYRYLNLSAGGVNLGNAVSETIRYRFLNPTAGGALSISNATSGAVRYRFLNPTAGGALGIDSATSPPVRYRYLNPSEAIELQTAISGTIIYRMP